MGHVSREEGSWSLEKFHKCLLSISGASRHRSQDQMGIHTAVSGCHVQWILLLRIIFFLKKEKRKKILIVTLVYNYSL